MGDHVQDQTVFWAVIVFVLVEGALVFAIFKFRGRPDDPEPAQVHGSTLEIAWTIIPALILAIIAVPTVKTIFKTSDYARRRGQDRGDRPPVVVGVPLSGPRSRHRQRDEFPGREDGESRSSTRRTCCTASGCRSLPASATSSRAARPALVQGRVTGIFRGQCAEFCGIQHARMAFHVLADAGGVRRLGRRMQRGRARHAGEPRRPTAARCRTASAGATLRAQQQGGAKPDSAAPAPAHAAGRSAVRQGRAALHDERLHRLPLAPGERRPAGLIGPNLANVGAPHHVVAGWLRTPTRTWSGGSRIPSRSSRAC